MITEISTLPLQAFESFSPITCHSQLKLENYHSPVKLARKLSIFQKKSPTPTNAATRYKVSLGLLHHGDDHDEHDAIVRGCCSPP